MSGATAIEGEPLQVIRSKESGVRCYGVYNRRKCKEPLREKKSLVDEIQAPPAPEPSTAPLPSHQWQSPGLHPKTEQPEKIENLEVLFFSELRFPPLKLFDFLSDTTLTAIFL